jgi:predicted metal-dependent hydrolase
MANSQITELPELGTIHVQKKRGVKRITMRLHSSGEIRVSQPFYLPYSAGLYFAKSHREWILKQRKKTVTLDLYDGMPIGKVHTLHILPSDKLSTRVSKNVITVTAPIEDIQQNNPQYVTTIKKAIKRALNKEATQLLPNRLQQLADHYGYSYKEVKIKPMKSRWGSCSNTSIITLNCYLVMLPWEITDYVMLHELSHTKQMNHSDAFWNEVAISTPNHKQLRSELKRIQPKIHAFYV